MTIELRPTSSLSLEEFAALFNAAYEDYVIPFRLDEEGLRSMIDWFDIDPEASRVALDDGEPVGFANLAVRDHESWVGAVGVVPGSRRRGIAQALMRALHEQAAARDVRRIWLEVIDQNEAAFKLYEKLGYRAVREVQVWSLPAEPETGSAREVPPAVAEARIRDLRASRDPWQRADGTVAHYGDVRGLEADSGAALFRVAGVVQLLQIAGDDTEELLHTLRRHGTVSVLNLPLDDPATDSLRALGAKATVGQREMVFELED